MSKFISNITPGTQYQDALAGFLKKEARAGHISLSGMRRMALKRNVSGISALVSGLVMLSTGAGFITTGNTAELFMMIGSAANVLTGMFVLAHCPGGLFYRIAKIENAFTHASLLRLVACGVPEDVLHELIVLLNKHAELSYAQVYDVVWLCSRQASGTTEQRLLTDRYNLIRSRLSQTTKRAC